MIHRVLLLWIKAALIAAKDCKAPIMTSIQGDKGSIIIHTPANTLIGFDHLLNDNTTTPYALQDNKHRMYFEFLEFVKIFNEMNFDKADEMMKNSLIAMDIATKARMSAGVHFKADEAHE